MEEIEAERQSSYGHPRDNFDRIARIWSVILGIPVTEEQVGWCMVGVKMSREVYAKKRDNLDDSIGYLRCIQRIQDDL